jgi:hypothetical protein
MQYPIGGDHQRCWCKWQSPHWDADDWKLLLSAVPNLAERYVNYELVDQPGEDILSHAIREGVKELGLHGGYIEEYTVDRWMCFEFVRPAFPHGLSLRNHKKTCVGAPPNFLSPMPFIVASEEIHSALQAKEPVHGWEVSSGSFNQM